MSKKRRKHRGRRKSAFKSFINWLTALAVVIIVGFIVRTYVAVPVAVSGQSMADTYNDGDIVLATRFDYMFGTPERGDVVLCEVDGRDGMYVKRVVGLPGDYVEITNGMISINGEPLHETYVTYASSETMSVQLNKDQYMCWAITVQTATTAARPISACSRRTILPARCACASGRWASNGG